VEDTHDVGDASPSRLLLLCHSGGWDRLYQAVSAAAAAASLDREVDMVFFFGALDRLLRGELDEVRLPGEGAEAAATLERRIEETGTRPISAMLADARASGRVRIFACSASTALTGHVPEEAITCVDEVIGWPTVIRLMEGAAPILYI
jgi:peroxiredoxin family protein